MPFSTSFATSAAMIGRDAELARLQTLCERALRGAPTAAVISGEAGIGKSRLLREFASSVHDAADVVTGRNVDLGSAAAPYGAILGLLRALTGMRGASEVWRAAGPGRAALLRLMPELADQAEAGTDVTADSQTPERMREAFVTLMETLSTERPIVLVIEDIQWADEGTLHLLSFLLSIATHGRLLVLLSWRIVQSRLRDPVRLFVREAQRAGMLEQIELERLEPGAARELALALSGDSDDEAIERLTERADGVPLFVEELSRQCLVPAPLPETLRDTLLGGYATLSDDAAHVTRVAAVAAEPPGHELLALVSGLDGRRLDAAAREAVDAGVLLVEGNGYAFRHALLRDAVHDELLPGERVRLHRAYAEQLQAELEADPRRQLHAELAHHWRGAHDQRRALISSLAAMEAAKARYAFGTAARFGEVALELWDQVPDPDAAVGIDRMTLTLRVGSALRNAGRSDRALATVTAALADEALTDRPTLHAKLLRDKAQYLANLGRPGAAEALQQALQVLDERDVHDDHLWAVVLNTLAGRHMVAGDTDAAMAAADEAWEYAVRADDEAQMSIARNMRGASRVHKGEIDAGLEDFAAARAHASDPSAALRYFVNYSDTLTLLGWYREAVDVADEGLQRARASGVERTSGSMLMQNMVDPLIELGDISRAEALLRRSLERRTFPVVRAYLAASRVRVLAWHDRRHEAEAVLRDERPAFETAAQTERQVWYGLLEMQVAIAEASDDPATALAAVQRMLDDEAPVTLHAVRILLQASADVAALRATGSRTDAAAMAQRIEDAWNAFPSAWTSPAWATILRALLHPTVDSLCEAVATADNGGAPAIFRVITRLESARLHVGERDRSAAASVLTQAADIARQLQHEQLQRSVAAFGLQAGIGTGLLPSDDGGTRAIAAAGFTAREAQVLNLLAEGLTNRQIADRLVISVKTVSVHVSAILRKLGVASRTEAALAAREAELAAQPTG
ncbi:AAA family ATPase [Microbacterium terrisoli]|uniref:AAA family ATPase n=1 Tax=Microbacterium terrisoli TaxID=3242192 RepID=UPI002805F220|nr:AAA family ATPase [Microbacterium protaetiae]